MKVKVTAEAKLFRPRNVDLNPIVSCAESILRQLGLGKCVEADDVSAVSVRCYLHCDTTISHMSIEGRL